MHLDSRQFMARLPDRDKLIDEDVQKADRYRVEGLLAPDAGGRQDPAFARTLRRIYYAAMRAWGHVDLLNDLDVLPAELFDEIVDYPIQDDDRRLCPASCRSPTRQAVESGAVTLVSPRLVGRRQRGALDVGPGQGYLVSTGSA